MKELKLIKSLSTPTNQAETRKIIQGENLDILELLAKDYRDKVKCIYIDPPYNNGENYRHYDDSIHDEWIVEIKKRLRKLKPLLTPDGSIWISIDDSEVHYLKVAADEIFERNNFVTTIIWQQRTTRENRKIFSNNHEYILVYAKNKTSFTKSVNKLKGNGEQLARYKNPDNDKRGPWQSVSLNVQDGHAVKSQFYELVSPNGKIHNPPKGRCWVYNNEKMNDLAKDGRIWFGLEGKGVPRLKKFLSESEIKITPDTLWLGSDVGTNKEAKKHLIKLFPEKEVFDTPKPEKLLKRIFEIATKENDLILDAYVGAGSTIAVAHKMKRQYIGIDKGDHIIDYVVARQRLVLKGKGLGILERVSEINEGFEFYTLTEKAEKKSQSNKQLNLESKRP